MVGEQPAPLLREKQPDPGKLIKQILSAYDNGLLDGTPDVKAAVQGLRDSGMRLVPRANGAGVPSPAGTDSASGSATNATPFDGGVPGGSAPQEDVAMEDAMEKGQHQVISSDSGADENVDDELEGSDFHVKRNVLEAIEAGTYEKLFTFHDGDVELMVNIEDPYLTVFDCHGSRKNRGFMMNLYPTAFTELTAAKRVRDEQPVNGAMVRYLPLNPNRPGPRGRKGMYELVIAEQRHDYAKVNQKDPSKFVLLFQDTGNLRIFTELYRGVVGFDWTSPADILALNRWRVQTITRRLGQDRFDETDDHWVVDDQESLNFFVKTIIVSATRNKQKDAFGRIDWIAVARDFKVAIAPQPRNTPLVVIDEKEPDGRAIRRKLPRFRPLASFTAFQVETGGKRTLDTHVIKYEYTAIRAIISRRRPTRARFTRAIRVLLPSWTTT